MSDETRCLAEVKAGQREKRRVVAESRVDAANWVESELDNDPTVGEYTSEVFRKLVYTDDDDSVVAFIEEIQTLEDYRASDPLASTEQQTYNETETGEVNA